MRGNLPHHAPPAAVDGSIPASAGEPPGGGVSTYRGKVYPRECGGTTVYIAPPSIVIGLSPRVRGNHKVSLRDVINARSIPASAGEPAMNTAILMVFSVYPRECGGTEPAEYDPNDAPGLSPRVRGNQG